MKTALTTFSLSLGLFFIPLAQAQENTENPPNNENVSEQNGHRRFWDLTLPGGSYIVALDRIAAVSMHSYFVKGAIVHEVSIESSGSALVRIYTMQPLGADGALSTASNLANRGKELLDSQGSRVGMTPSTSVTKEYPLTTHAKTIEFRVSSKQDLDALYDSLTKSWRENRGRKLIIK